MRERNKKHILPSVLFSSANRWQPKGKTQQQQHRDEKKMRRKKRINRLKFNIVYIFVYCYYINECKELQITCKNQGNKSHGQKSEWK